MRMESWTLSLIRQFRNRVTIQSRIRKTPSLTEMCAHRRSKTPRKILTTSLFWIKVFCLVAITFASPKVSVTANEQFPRREEMRDVRLVIDISRIFFFFFFNIVSECVCGIYMLAGDRSILRWFLIR